MVFGAQLGLAGFRGVRLFGNDDGFDVYLRSLENVAIYHEAFYVCGVEHVSVQVKGAAVTATTGLSYGSYGEFPRLEVVADTLYAYDGERTFKLVDELR